MESTCLLIMLTLPQRDATNVEASVSLHLGKFPATCRSSSTYMVQVGSDQRVWGSSDLQLPGRVMTRDHSSISRKVCIFRRVHSYRSLPQADVHNCRRLHPQRRRWSLLISFLESFANLDFAFVCLTLTALSLTHESFSECCVQVQDRWHCKGNTADSTQVT